MSATEADAIIVVNGDNAFLIDNNNTGAEAPRPRPSAAGRPRKYNTEAQRKKALAAYLKDNHEMVNGDIITVHVKVTSRKLGEIEENVRYRVINKDKELFQKLN